MKTLFSSVRISLVNALPLVLCFLLLAVMATPVGAQSGSESLSYESYTEINQRWVEYQRTMEGLEQDAWQAKFHEFFIDITYDHLYNICLTENCGDDKTVGREVGDLLKARIQVEAPTVDEMLMFISDESLCAPCIMPFFNTVYRHKEQYINGDASQAQALSGAFMALAENHEALVKASLEMERLAVELWSDEATMAKMMAYCTSTNLDSYIHGATMLSYSRDPAATDSLGVIVGKWIEGIYTIEAFGEAMKGLARRLGPDAYYILDPVYRSERSEQTRNEAFSALMLTQNPRIFELLLGKYVDLHPDGVEQKTHALSSGPKRDGYYEIWGKVKDTEPAMITLFNSGPSEETNYALEVLDRASQFAGPKDKTGIAAALENYKAVAPVDQQERVAELIVRLQNWKKGVRP